MARVWERLRATTPAGAFLILSSLIGLGYLVATPPLRTPDEYRHLHRVVQITSGGVIAGAMIPASLEELARALRDEPGGARRRASRNAFAFAKLAAAASIPLDARRVVDAPPDRYLSYSPVVYLPAVVATALGTHLQARPLTLLYVARLSLLAGGIALLFLAIRLTPALAWVLCLVALLPTASYVRSGVTADTLTMACAFLLFAMVLRLKERPGQIGSSDVALLAGVGACLALCKTGYLPLTWTALALPASRFASARARWLALLAVIGVPLLVGALWLHVLGDWVSSDNHRRSNADEQLRLLLEDPARFVWVLDATWLSAARLWQVANTFVGRIVVLTVPAFFTWLALAAVAVLASGDTQAAAPRLVERLLFAAAAVACVVIISLGLYLKWTSPGSATVRGFQGRYLYPLAPFLLFALQPPRGLRWRCPPSVATILVALVVGLANAWGMTVVIAATWFGDG